jgi:hypothetical protein
MPKPDYYQIVRFYCGEWAGIMERCETEAEAELRSQYYNETYHPDDNRVKYAPEAVYSRW